MHISQSSKLICLGHNVELGIGLGMYIKTAWLYPQCVYIIIRSIFMYSQTTESWLTVLCYSYEDNPDQGEDDKDKKTAKVDKGNGKKEK